MPCGMDISAGDLAMSATNDLRRDMRELPQVVGLLRDVVNEQAQDLCALREIVLLGSKVEPIASDEAQARVREALMRLYDRQREHRRHDAERARQARDQANAAI